MRSILLLVVLLAPLSALFSQQTEEQVPKVIDSLYREDQFYVGLTYNALVRLNPNVTQTGFSTGFHLGFIRDMPINKRRNFSIGLGVGLNSNSYIQNIAITQTDSDYDYNLVPEGVSVSRNKFTTYMLDVPLEFRWRTSTPTQNRFWRVYPGFKFSYLLYNTTKFRSELGNVDLSNVKDFNDLQYGVTIGVGYGDWNFHFYYALNPIFNESAQLEGQPLTITAMKIGLIFYIL
ncbi:porin family protein [Winogradskyella aurantiaca]|uniref:porin family protein n=1 Tax=Winogradskyella aurantiaca TaxID=2219558 RepID=UPI000E1CA687|nr:porin family protein [Winogradskyella aurantiaca]